jgi:hypothetical protein
MFFNFLKFLVQNTQTSEDLQRVLLCFKHVLKICFKKVYYYTIGFEYKHFACIINIQASSIKEEIIFIYLNLRNI